MAKSKHLIALAFLLPLVFALFGGTLGHRFNSDDYLVVYHATRHSAPAPAEILKEFARPSWGLYYRPGIKLFFEALGGAFGLMPEWYHLVSLICYALLCFQVYLVGWLLSRRLIVALSAAVVFMMMNAHAEAIFWISSLNGVVENILSMASLISFIWWRRSSRRFLYPLSLVLFAAALLTKESAVSLPIILIFYDFLLGGEVSWPDAVKRTIKSNWPFVLMGASFVLIRYLVMRQADLPPALTSFEWRTFIVGLWHALIMTLSPIDWALALGWFGRLTAAGIFFYVFGAAAILAVALIPFILKRFRVTFLLWWILAGAAPVLALGLVPSERHVVFASAGAAILAAVVFFKVADKLARRTAASPIMLLSLFLAIYSAPNFYFLKQRQMIWKHASEVAANVVEQTEGIFPAPPPNTTFFFLNVPDSAEGALILRFDNLAYALRLYYGDPSVDAVRIVTLDKVPRNALSNPKFAYFRISAMGGHVYIPEGGFQNVQLKARLREIEEMGILPKDDRYMNEWDRYRSSPFLIYTAGSLMPSSPENLKEALQNLYSVN